MDTRATLLRVAELLNGHGDDSWTRAFIQWARDYDHSPESVMQEVRRIFGGMGSFNDIVLHDPSGVPLQSENNELDRLRSHLWEACRGRTRA